MHNKNPHTHMVETDTVYYTPSGEVVVPGEPMEIPIPEMRATYKSNMAPLWLVFSEHIINTHNIASIDKKNDSVRIHMVDGKYTDIKLSDEVWGQMQKVFADGLNPD